MKQDLNVVKKRYEAADGRIESLSKVVDSLRTQIDALQSDKLRRNIRITGFSNGQFDIKKVVHSIGTTLGVGLADSDIEDLYKYNTKQGQHVIVTFGSKTKAEALLNARKGKSIYTDEVDLVDMGRRQIYLQEDLTRTTQELLFNARKLKESHGYKFVWSKKGKVYARASETSKAIRIDSLVQLKKLSEGQLVDNEKEEEEGDINLNRTIMNYLM